MLLHVITLSLCKVYSPLLGVVRHPPPPFCFRWFHFPFCLKNKTNVLLHVITLSLCKVYSPLLGVGIKLDFRDYVELSMLLGSFLFLVLFRSLVDHWDM